ncbi:hypothetical protein V2J09_019688 [Rumex salicifolius]
MSYLLPLMAVIDAVDWIEIGSVLSSIGLFEAQMSSCTYQVLGMANIGFLLRFCAARSNRFKKPWSCMISLGASFLEFDDIVEYPLRKRKTSTSSTYWLLV